MICIWCRDDFEKLSLEHAIPDALACPPELELDNVACAGCNSRLGMVDLALVKQFEGITVMYGVPRKRGRPPTIDNWRSISSTHEADGPQFFINAGPGVIQVKGKKLYPASKANGIINVWTSPEEGRFGYSQQFGNDRRFLPSLYKIGLNLVAKHFGPKVAAASPYDHIRAFVRAEKGTPKLTAAMGKTATSGEHFTAASAPIMKPGRSYPMFGLTILGVSFLIDLAPDQRGLRDIRAAAMLHGEPMYLFPLPSST